MNVNPLNSQYVMRFSIFTKSIDIKNRFYYTWGVVTNYGEDGNTKREGGGHVKFYPYEKGGGHNKFKPH